jgi:hypothetical protein
MLAQNFINDCTYLYYCFTLIAAQSNIEVLFAFCFLPLAEWPTKAIAYIKMGTFEIA